MPRYKPKRIDMERETNPLNTVQPFYTERSIVEVENASA
jgi:hypothetical protein